MAPQATCLGGPCENPSTAVGTRARVGMLIAIRLAIAHTHIQKMTVNDEVGVERGHIHLR